MLDGRSGQGSTSGRTVPVSVVIPVRDEAATLPTLLAGLDAQTVLPEQVVVVDGGSTDATVAMLKEHAVRDARYTVVVADGPASPGRGRNLGVAAARLDWIAFTDAGMRLEPTWVERLWQAHLQDPAALVVYGNYEFDVRSRFERYASVAYGEYKTATPAGPCRGPSVVSVLLHRDAFDAVGGFLDSRSGEDEVFTRAVTARGLHVGWAPDATVWWRLRPDLASTFERFRSYSYHYARAGEQRHWQRPLARRYVPVVAGAVLAATHSSRWVPLALAPVAARTLVRVRRHGHEGDGRWLQPQRLLGVAGLVLLTDAATFVGWAQAARDARRS